MSHLYQDDHPSAHEILDPTLGGDGDLEQAYVDEALAQQYTEDTVSQYQQHQQQLAQNTLQGIEHLYNTSGDVVLDQEDGVGGSRIPEDQYLTEQPTLEHPDLGDGVGEVPEKIDGRKSGNHNRNPHGNNQYGKPVDTDVLKVILRKYFNEDNIKDWKTVMNKLETEHDIKIRRATLGRYLRMFNLGGSRRAGFTRDQAEPIVLEHIRLNDPECKDSPVRIMKDLGCQGIHIKRDVIRAIMQDHFPDGFEVRRRNSKFKKRPGPGVVVDESVFEAMEMDAVNQNSTSRAKPVVAGQEPKKRAPAKAKKKKEVVEAGGSGEQVQQDGAGLVNGQQQGNDGGNVQLNYGDNYHQQHSQPHHQQQQQQNHQQNQMQNQNNNQQNHLQAQHNPYGSDTASAQHIIMTMALQAQFFRNANANLAVNNDNNGNGNINPHNTYNGLNLGQHQNRSHGQQSPMQMHHGLGGQSTPGLGSNERERTGTPQTARSDNHLTTLHDAAVGTYTGGDDYVASAQQGEGGGRY